MNIYYIFNKLFSIINEFSNNIKNISQYPFTFDNKTTHDKEMNIFIDKIVKELFYLLS